MQLERVVVVEVYRQKELSGRAFIGEETLRNGNVNSITKAGKTEYTNTYSSTPIGCMNAERRVTQTNRPMSKLDLVALWREKNPLESGPTIGTKGTTGSALIYYLPSGPNRTRNTDQFVSSGGAYVTIRTYNIVNRIRQEREVARSAHSFKEKASFIRNADDLM